MVRLRLVEIFQAQGLPLSASPHHRTCSNVLHVPKQRYLLRFFESNSIHERQENGQLFSAFAFQRKNRHTWQFVPKNRFANAGSDSHGGRSGNSQYSSLSNLMSSRAERQIVFAFERSKRYARKALLVCASCRRSEGYRWSKI